MLMIIKGKIMALTMRLTLYELDISSSNVHTFSISSYLEKLEISN